MASGICVTVTASSMAELRERRDRLSGADLVELRLDSVRDPDVAGALGGRRTPVIVTCRPQWEGGEFRGSEEERHRLLCEALRQGAEYVDVEWRAGFDDLIRATVGRRVVLSTHDFDGVPSDLTERADAMRATGAEVIKIAAKANRLSDCIPLMETGVRMRTGGKAVIIAMGPRGIASRVLADRFGSAWTYAGLLGGIGQLTPETLTSSYSFRSLGPSTGVYGLAGSPVAQSVSPAMHNLAFKDAHLDAVYLPFDAADADDFVTFARAVGLNGASVTIPFKVALFNRVDDVDPVARTIGAINTIQIENGRWFGSNTDAAGFLAPLEERGVALQNRRASILGAGGSARAVAAALVAAGAAVRVHARNPDRARDVASAIAAEVGPWPPAPGSWDLLVNCTPIGMHPMVDATPLPREALTGSIVYDLVYNPQRTRLLGDAAAMRCQAIGGLEMLVAQAREQFYRWTGVRPPAALMAGAAARQLSEYLER